jgi:hypothetical protein
MPVKRTKTVLLPDWAQRISMRYPERHYAAAICIAYITLHPGIDMWMLCSSEKMHQCILTSNFTRGLARELRESKLTSESIEEGLDWVLYLLVRAGEWAFTVTRHFLEYHEHANEVVWDADEIEAYFPTLILDWPNLWRVYKREQTLYMAIVYETVRQLKVQFPEKFLD